MLKRLFSKAAGALKPEEVYSLRYVEGFDETRTIHGNKRVSAHLGRAGEKSDLFSVLLD